MSRTIPYIVNTYKTDLHRLVVRHEEIDLRRITKSVDMEGRTSVRELRNKQILSHSQAIKRRERILCSWLLPSPLPSGSKL